jgi:hypothetical protein
MRIPGALSLVYALFAVTALPQQSAQGRKPCAAGTEAVSQPGPSEEKEQREVPKKKTRGKFTIGKETTYVTGPLGEDGYIDYVAALNERLREGVTPANNAVVLLWQAHGPRPGGATMPAEFFKWLGIPALPENGEYFIDLGQYLEAQGQAAREREIYDQLDLALARRWTAKDYPHLAGWLKANEKPLALVMEASSRSHYYSPVVPPKTKRGRAALTASLSGVQRRREMVDMLTARAMLRAGQGAHDAAWQDLLACHRLSRLIGSGGTLIEGLIGITLENQTSKADLAYLEHAERNAKRIGKYLGDLRKLPALPVMADKLDLCERFMFFDVVMMMDRHGPKVLERLSSAKSDWTDDANPMDARGMELIEWDLVLRNANRWYDRLAAAMRLKERDRREEQLEQMEKEQIKLRRNAVSLTVVLKLLLASKEGARIEASKRIGDILISLLAPAVRKIQQAVDRTQQVENNLTLAFALALYRAEHGRYPEKLDALAPKYLPRIPQDVFSGKFLIYRPSETGYLLYSVGVNGRDDGGRGDDLAVRMPLPKLRRNE